jgi:hypothetical protein
MTAKPQFDTAWHTLNQNIQKLQDTHCNLKS